jgi:hypothetical protein
VGHALDHAALGDKVARASGPDASPLRTFDGGAAHARVVPLNGLEISQERPDSFGWARGVDFVVDGGHGVLHK